jgi:enoyl-CoA hydratase/carnithine racemase
MAQGEFARYEKEGHVARITITRPERMNALHPPASREMAEMWDEFANDDDAWIAVLTGEGDRAFSAGNDLKFTAEMGRKPEDERPVMQMPESGFGGITSRFDLFKPVIARINGFALGGGLEMALACDILVAADHARLGLPEPRVGLYAGALGVHRLPRQIPMHQALGYMLTARHMEAPRAYELGLVNQLVPLADLDNAVDAWIGDILKCSPLSVRATKEAALTGLGMPLPEAAKARYEGVRRMASSEDYVEGPRAFAEKREPQWKGR